MASHVKPGNVLGLVKRNPLFLHEIKWKNNGFIFTTPNIIMRGIETVTRDATIAEFFENISL